VHNLIPGKTAEAIEGVLTFAPWEAIGEPTRIDPVTLASEKIVFRKSLDPSRGIRELLKKEFTLITQRKITEAS
jgi:hypothetical protein